MSDQLDELGARLCQRVHASMQKAAANFQVTAKMTEKLAATYLVGVKTTFVN
ncbi:hypothetical protein LACPH_002064 [Lacticaseibacillus parahuelsenbergensis]|uniref:Uncharacterized protein n=1 Tax=Lacticaseibacillus parahuelsenbergensis TaxID=3068305 RepID=A0ABY9L0W4_9LACO|nr:hypothetical protein [Lacticaseibacillus sp. NCIMB 15471]WLV77324.1 hypothetical protein LACPH_002064 [Lacticaseibacillus sp. NCIMB 15471]